MDATSLREVASSAIAASEAALSRLLELPASADYATTVRAIDDILRPLNGIEGRVQLFSKVDPDPDVREAALIAEQEISVWTTELSLDRGLYDRIAPLEQREAPGDDEARITELVLRSLRRAGVDRDEATRARIKELKDEIVKIGQEFDRNIIEADSDFVVEGGHAELAGLPQDFIDAHPEREDGSVLISTDPQDRMTVMCFAHSADLRQRYYMRLMNRAAPHNIDVLRTLLERRHELATLLGHANWADFITEDKMAESGAQARSFIERVVGLTHDQVDREYAELLEEKRRDEPAASAVHEWERAYLTERIKQRKFEFDSQVVRPYLAYQTVRDGVLRTSEELYGIRFVRDEAAERWHPSVECYEVVDGEKTVARFWLDMHPRKGKFKHAAMFDMTSGIAGEELPEACLVCNMPEPKAGDPALMMRGEVRTFFHEFGHLLHHLFSNQPYVRTAGITCEWDFVEVPSQLYEEWTWDYGVLATFAKHFESGEVIPAELVERMRRAEEYGKGMWAAGQMFYAMLALDYYSADPAAIDLLGHMVELKAKVLPFPHEPGTHFIASFGHLHGYSAMYYTYMWSLVIAKDLFSRFDGDVMNKATAADYRRTVTSRGGSRPAKQLVHDFLGRDYAFEAFECWLAR